MRLAFEGFDFAGFWDNDDCANDEYIGAKVTDAMIRSAEKKLGYKLPTSYVVLLRNQNGGTPRRSCHRTKSQTSWAKDHIAITGIYGVDKRKESSLCGECSSKFWEEEWGYPPIGVYFCECPSAGHDMICLDYSKCGKDGEPQVVHVDQECDYKITVVAENFEQFIRGLVSEDEFEE